MTLALTVFKKSTFPQKKSHLNALGRKFDLDVKGIGNLAIILVPLIITLSRGHTRRLGDYDFLTGGNKVVP